MSPQPARKLNDGSPAIPDRLYFRIGDVARLCGVETYVLRFWETQFPQLKPNKSGTGQRLYRRRDVEIALEIKRLVHESGYTIQGARQRLEQSPRRREAPIAISAPAPEVVVAPIPVAVPEKPESPATLAQVRTELREIATILAAPIEEIAVQSVVLAIPPVVVAEIPVEEPVAVNIPAVTPETPVAEALAEESPAIQTAQPEPLPELVTVPESMEAVVAEVVAEEAVRMEAAEAEAVVDAVVVEAVVVEAAVAAEPVPTEQPEAPAPPTTRSRKRSRAAQALDEQPMLFSFQS